LKIFVIPIIINIVFLSYIGSFDDCAEAKDIKMEQLRSDHFIINYDPQVDKNYISKIKNIAERYYKVITQEFNLVRNRLWLWDNRAKIFIAKDKAAYLKEFDCHTWSAACVNYQDKIIYTYSGDARFVPIFIHELTHIIFREYIGTGNFPLWLDEGVAVYMENKYGGGNYKSKLRYLTRIIDNGKYIKLSELSGITADTLRIKPDDYVDLFYTESFSIVNFIIDKYGQHSFSNFMSFLKKGNSLDEALSRAIYDLRSLNELESQWQNFYQR